MIEVYYEPQILKTLTYVFNYLNLFLIFFIPFFINERTINFQTNKIKYYLFSFITINIFIYFSTFKLFSTFIIYLIILSFFIVFYYSLNLKKSLKWINISFIILTLFIVFSYNLYTYIINNFIYDILNSYNLGKINIKYKNYFYLNNDFFNIININNNFINNDVLFKRLYLFYYLFNSIALIIWSFVYLKVLRKHKF